MTDLQKVELDLLKVFDKICKKNNLTYFMAGGSLIGTMRHKGFIPWDDDIDVYMKCDDYFKLCNIASTEFTGKYFWQTEITDPGSLRFHAQLRNSETTCILKTEYKKRHSFNNGVFIDIFPIFNLPDDKQQLATLYKLVTYLSMHRNHNNYIKFETLAKKLNNKNSNFIGTLWHHNTFRKFNTNWYDEIIYEQFEDMLVPVPKMFDNILSLEYGNWRVPKHVQSCHGNLIVDLTKSYKDFN